MDDETTSTPVLLTLGTAAKHAGLAKSTVLRAIRSGKLSAQRSPETNSYKIHPAELYRYVEAMQVLRNAVAKSEVEQPATPNQPTETPLETPQTALLAELRTLVEELRSDRDHWRTLAERVALPAQGGERRRLRGWLRRVTVTGPVSGR